MNEIHTTTVDQCLVVALDEFPGGTAKDYANHVVKSVQHLSYVHTFNDIFEEAMPIKDVYKTMSLHIICSLTDKAAANHVSIRLSVRNVVPHCRSEPLSTSPRQHCK